MVAVNIGTIIKKETLKDGVKQDGSKWLFGTVNAEQGYDRITVWAANPDDVSRDSDLEVSVITGVKISNRKYKAKDGSEKWATEYHINAKLEKVAGSEIPEGFSMTDEDIPF